MANFINEAKNFEIISRELIFDNELSDRARFLYCYMAAKPDGWDFFMQPMAKELGYSTKTLRKYIRELIERGWLVCEGQYTCDGKFGATSYTLKAARLGCGKNSFLRGKFVASTKVPYGKFVASTKVPHIDNRDNIENRENIKENRDYLEKESKKEKVDQVLELFEQPKSIVRDVAEKNERKFLDQFKSHTTQIESFCMSNRIGVELFLQYVDEVFNEWQLQEITHCDYKEFAYHLQNTVRIVIKQKRNEVNNTTREQRLAGYAQAIAQVGIDGAAAKDPLPF